MEPKDKLWVRFTWGLHKWLYTLSGGRIGSRLARMEVLHLFTVGRKSGRPRDHLLTYLREGDDYLVAASNGGADVPPSWYFNLKAHADTRIRVRGRDIQVRARETKGAERDALWAKFKATENSYARYERKTKRVIPVIALEPVAGN